MNNKELDFGDNLISIDGFEVLYTITRDFPEVSNFFLFLLNCVDKYNRNMEISVNNLTENCSSDGWSIRLLSEKS